jgi:hypothetical protein
MEESAMRVSRRRLLAGSIALQPTANNNYASARTDQATIPLDATATQVQGWKRFCRGLVSEPGTPTFGPNVFAFAPTRSSSTMQNPLNSVFNQQQSPQSGANRYAFLFKPGIYNVDINLDFHIQSLISSATPGPNTSG